MKLYNYNIRIITAIVFFFLNGYIFSQEYPCHVSSIYKYFEENSSSLYYIGIRHFYLGSLFNSEFKNNNFEDNYTEILYVIPVNKGVGICIQGDQQNVLDTFTFVFDPTIEKFRATEENENILLRFHRYDVLNEITKIRFTIHTLNGLNSLLMLYNIVIK